MITPRANVSASYHIVPLGQVNEGLAVEVVGQMPLRPFQTRASTTVPPPLVTVMFGTTRMIASGMEFAGNAGNAPGYEDEKTPATSNTFQLAVASPGSMHCATM